MLTITYLALGDSYTIGEGVLPAEGFPMQTARLLRENHFPVADPVIIARTGWTTGELAAAMDAAGIDDGTYGIVTLLIGVNDQYRGENIQGYWERFTALLERAIGLAGGNAGHVFVLSVPDWGATPFAQRRDKGRIAREIAAFNAANKAISDSRYVHYLDITPGTRLMEQDAALVAPDGLHPSAKEYAVWAGALAKMIREVYR